MTRSWKRQKLSHPSPSPVVERSVPADSSVPAESLAAADVPVTARDLPSGREIMAPIQPLLIDLKNGFDERMRTLAVKVGRKRGRPKKATKIPAELSNKVTVVHAVDGLSRPTVNQLRTVQETGCIEPRLLTNGVETDSDDPLQLSSRPVIFNTSHIPFPGFEKVRSYISTTSCLF